MMTIVESHLASMAVSRAVVWCHMLTDFCNSCLDKKKMILPYFQNGTQKIIPILMRAKLFKLLGNQSLGQEIWPAMTKFGGRFWLMAKFWPLLSIFQYSPHPERYLSENIWHPFVHQASLHLWKRSENHINHIISYMREREIERAVSARLRRPESPEPVSVSRVGSG